jgi:hypothetical protein
VSDDQKTGHQGCRAHQANNESANKASLTKDQLDDKIRVVAFFVPVSREAL